MGFIDMARVTKPNILEAFKNFDTLPNSAYVRDLTVAKIIGASRSKVWRMAKAGRLPSPKKISERITGWSVGELRAYLASL
jgi:predicted DNA-binding transcriptional regulator AlpA